MYFWHCLLADRGPFRPFYFLYDTLVQPRHSYHQLMLSPLSRTSVFYRSSLPPTPSKAAIFERRRKYGVPVWMSRHPDLNDYIYQVKILIMPVLFERSRVPVLIALSYILLVYYDSTLFNSTVDCCRMKTFHVKHTVVGISESFYWKIDFVTF